MAKEIKPKIPRYITRPRLILTMEMDVVIGMVVSFAICYFVFVMMGMSVLALLPSSVVSYIVKVTLEDSKEEKKLKGYFRHILWTSGTWQPKKDENKYPELKRIKDKWRLPYGIENEFVD